MKIAYGRLALIILAAFMASAAPEFDASWKSQHIPDNATFGTTEQDICRRCIALTYTSTLVHQM